MNYWIVEQLYPIKFLLVAKKKATSMPDPPNTSHLFMDAEFARQTLRACHFSNWLISLAGKNANTPIYRFFYYLINNGTFWAPCPEARVHKNLQALLKFTGAYRNSRRFPESTVNYKKFKSFQRNPHKTVPKTVTFATSDSLGKKSN